MFRSRLPLIAGKLEAEMRAAELAGAHLIEQRAKQRVPVNTGRLRDAIHVESDDDGAAVVAGDTEAFYGHIVEHGGVRQAAHPFLIPAAEESRDEVVKIAAAMLRAL
jgi:HK97 gp10 family phage protein